MAELRLNGEMNLLSTRYRVSSDCACRFKRQKWMVEVLRETSSDIGRIGLTGHERELLECGRCVTWLGTPVGLCSPSSCISPNLQPSERSCGPWITFSAPRQGSPIQRLWPHVDVRQEWLSAPILLRQCGISRLGY